MCASTFPVAVPPSLSLCGCCQTLVTKLPQLPTGANSRSRGQWQCTIALSPANGLCTHRLGHTQTLMVRECRRVRCASSAASYYLLLSISVSYPWCNVHKPTVLRSHTSSAKHEDSVYILGDIVESKVASGSQEAMSKPSSMNAPAAREQHTRTLQVRV